MATCKDYDMCPQAQVIEKTHICKHFKDQSRFIEVPCKIGDTAWAIRTCGKTKKSKIRYSGRSWHKQRYAGYRKHQADRLRNLGT